MLPISRHTLMARRKSRNFSARIFPWGSSFPNGARKQKASAGTFRDPKGMRSDDGAQWADFAPNAPFVAPRGAEGSGRKFPHKKRRITESFRTPGLGTNLPKVDVDERSAFAKTETVGLWVWLFGWAKAPTTPRIDWRSHAIL